MSILIHSKRNAGRKSASVPALIWLDTLFNYNEQPGKGKRTGLSRTVLPFAHEFPEKTSRHSLSRGPV